MAADTKQRADMDKSGMIKLKLPARPEKPSRTKNGMIKLTLPPRPEKKRKTKPGSAPPPSAVPASPAKTEQRAQSPVNTPQRPQRAQSPVSTAAGQAPAPREKTPEELATLASSVVMIYCRDQQGKIFASGSGIMIGRRGFILTNCHVISGALSFAVKIENDEREYVTDEVIKYNSVHDLAVIRIERFLDPIPLCPEDRKTVRGQRVIAIGSPLGFFNTVSDGIISGFRQIDGTKMTQFTAPISKGSSGGAVINMYGELIGISTAGIDEGQNMNLFVGSEDIRGFVKGLL